MKRINNYLLFCLALAPAFLLLYLILKYKVNVPLYDQWSFAPFFEKINQGQLTFGDLFKQHNESRKFFTRLIFLPLAYLTHWNVRIELLVIFLFICLISFNVYRLSQITIGGGKFKTLSSFFLANLIIFSPLQLSYWTWGLQFIPIALILTAIVVAYSKLKQITKFFLSLLLCLVSTFSFVSGLVSWAVVFPVLFITSKNEKESPALKKWLQIGWIFSFLVVIILYFYHYKKPPLHPDLLVAFIRPLEAIQYFLAFFGAPLGYGDLTAATIIGIVALSLWILLLAYFLILKRNNSTLLFKIKGWGAVGAYAFICGILTTFGRLGFGVGQVLATRYTIFSDYLFLSLFFLGVIFFEEVNLKSKSWLSQKLINGSLLFLLLIFSTLYLKTASFSWLKIKNRRQTELEGKACLLLIKIIPDEEYLKNKVFPKLDFLMDNVDIVERLKFLRPGLVKSRFIKDMAGKRQPSLDYGHFDVFKKIDNENIFIAGWAVLAERQEPADAVILTYKNAAGEEIIFKVVFEKTFRPDVAQFLKNPNYLFSGWQKQLGLAEIPKEAVKIKAWAMDAEAGRAYELKGEILCRSFRK